MDYYKEKLNKKILFYDVCLLITNNGGVNFDIIRLQTNDTLNIRIEAFINKKKVEMIKTKFKVKSQIILETDI